MLHLFQESEIASHCPQANALNKVIQDPPPTLFFPALISHCPPYPTPGPSGLWLISLPANCVLIPVLCAPLPPRQRPSSTPASAGDSDLY